MDATAPPDPRALRALPQVQRLLESAPAQALLARHPRAAVVEALRAALEGARRRILAGGPAGPVAELVADAQAALAAADRAGLRRVINATGVVLHTNLGRAPLAPQALAAMAQAAGGYSNLEYDLEQGRRGHRTAGVEPLLCELTGAQAALAVNNAAAAVLLALSALAGGALAGGTSAGGTPAGGGEVIVSRGELVEIGGGFRVPEVIVQGGARLVEVGSTNRTRLADYRNAITEHTRVLLKVHPSNYRIEGFTAQTSVAELAGLARERGLLVMQDLGSGAMLDFAALGRPHEPTAREALAAGADIVAFSGDKLMGGPQAGLLVGRATALAPLRRHPLLRAVRLDKASLAALEATLRLYRDPVEAARAIPALRMLAQTPDLLRARAERLAVLLGDVPVELEVRPSEGFAGGGALPGEAMASAAVLLRLADGAVDALAARLRRGRSAVVGRIAGDRLWLDMLTVADDELAPLAAAVCAAIDPAGTALAEGAVAGAAPGDAK